VEDPLHARPHRAAGPLALALVASAGAAAPAPDTRALAVTIDDLPIAGRHDDPAERERITTALLDALDRHRIRAVGFVVWDRVRGTADERILDRWLAAGHELGNHSASHLDYSRTDAPAYLADVERGRMGLSAFLDARGRTLRYFRFPYLREGETSEKLAAARAYLERTGQRNLRPTIDTEDWSFDAPWSEAHQRGDEAASRTIGADYLAALRLDVRRHERTATKLFDRPTAEILLLHANAVGAALWDDLFAWLVSTGHRFVGVDEALADPALGADPSYIGRYGLGLWDRMAAERREREADRDVRAVLDAQVAAWNRGDIEAFCSVYTDDATFLSPSGRTEGRAAILERYRGRYADRAAMGQLALEPIEVHLIHGTEENVLGGAQPGSVHGATVAARWRIERASGESLSGLTLIVLRRRPGGWVIVQDASM
jgi:peptidoglycan/xylan/chitin deacetylase (PgdA/CDA1 family)/ketosteroid isomerase-like protein